VKNSQAHALGIISRGITCSKATRCECGKTITIIRGQPALLKLGATIRALRLEKGLSQEALAEIANIDRSYMGGIERGEHNSTFINLIRIADALNLKTHQLLERADL